mgnify:CR=1 FL=1
MENETISTLYKGKVEVRFLGPTPDKPNRHMYYVGGERVTGVTTYLNIIDKSAALVGWAVDLMRDYLLDIKGPIMQEHIFTGSTLHSVRKQTAADLGSKIHDWCERYIKHKLKVKGVEAPEMPDEKEVQNGVSAFLDWEKSHKVKFRSSERTVYSKKHGYIGTMDIEADVDEILCLVDIKSSNGLYNPVRAQTAAYVEADQEESGRKYQGRWALRVSKETEREYDARMAKKAANKERAGKKAYDAKPYQVFEARFFDKGSQKSDFEAFLAAKALYEWNSETDFFKNP